MLRNLAAMKTTTYSGYSVWPDGLSIWPSRRRKRLWADLKEVRSEFDPRGNALVTTLVFRTGGPLKLRGMRLFPFGDGPGRFAELVAQAVAAAPENVAVDGLSFEIAQWGPREVRARLLAGANRMPGAAMLVERARHHRVWLEEGRALKAVTEALAQDRRHAGALALRHQLLLEQGKITAARQSAEEWVARRPEDPQARVALLQMQLAAKETAAVAEATEWLAREPGREELAACLAAYHFRTGNPGAAAEVWRNLGAAAPAPAVRARAQDRAAYAERTCRDPGFRRREQLKFWGRIVLAWSVLITVAVLQFYGVFATCSRRERAGRLREEQRQSLDERAEEMKRRLAESNRNFTELTGRVTGDYATVRERADQGEAAAQLTLAEMLFDGTKGAPKDPVTALEYLEKSAAQEHRAALLSLGDGLVEGKRLPKDAPRAAQLFERAMELGFPRAAAELAALHQKGDGVPQDAARALTLYEHAAAGGYVYAMAQAGWMHERGEGIPADRERALQYYRQAAEKKNAWATERLGALLWVAQADEPTREEAWKWIKHGAKNDLGPMRWRAAVMVLSGLRDDPEVEAVARTWLEQAAAKPESDARVQLAMCLLGGWGMDQDFTRAAALLESGEAHNIRARVEWVRSLAYGVGVARDVPRARKRLESLRDNPAHAELDRLVALAEVEPVPGEIPRPIFRKAPQYPLRLRRQNITGKAQISFRIDSEGFTEDVRITTATHPEFGRAGRLAVSYWRFHPAPAHAGRTYEQLLEFSLDEEKAEGANAGD